MGKTDWWVGIAVEVVEVYGFYGRDGCVLHIRDVHNGVFFFFLFVVLSSLIVLDVCELLEILSVFPHTTH